MLHVEFERVEKSQKYLCVWAESESEVESSKHPGESLESSLVATAEDEDESQSDKGSANAPPGGAPPRNKKKNKKKRKGPPKQPGAAQEQVAKEPVR